MGKAEIQRWLEDGKANGATHMLVVCDTYDFEDYPVYVYPPEKKSQYNETDVNRAFQRYNQKNMQKVMEVYSFDLSLKSQLNEHRAMHL